MDKRFTDIKPQISRVPYNPEPSLYTLIKDYYLTCIYFAEDEYQPAEIVEQYVTDYINEWVSIEKNTTQNPK